MEDFHRIHYSGNAQSDSTDDGRTSQAGSSSCKNLATLHGMRQEMMNYV